MQYIIPLSQLRMSDVERVGGKNASLGELISQLANAGVKVPDGFATTADAFREFIKYNNLYDFIYTQLSNLEVNNISELTNRGSLIRDKIIHANFPPNFESSIKENYIQLTKNNPNASFAVRSSATAEDLPDASFAGQQETVLNVVGIDAILYNMKQVFASL